MQSYEEKRGEEIIQLAFVNYFKKMPNVTEIQLQVTLSDVFGTNSFEEIMTIPVDFFPEIITRSFVLSIEKIRKLIDCFDVEKLMNRGLSCSVSIFVDLPGHKEKVTGSCVVNSCHL